MPKKKIKKRVAQKKTKKSNLLGVVTHYYGKISVAVIKLYETLKVGDYVELSNGEEKFSQIIESIQINHKQIMGARKGSEIGIKVAGVPQEGWKMFKSEQPSLLEVKTEQKPERKNFSYDPIFPKVSVEKREIPIFPSMVSQSLREKLIAKKKEEASPPKRSVVITTMQKTKEIKPPIQAPVAPVVPKNENRKGYGEVKFLKF